MARKLAPHSAAAALASRVLPVPGGPNSSTPLQGLQQHADKLSQDAKTPLIWVSEPNESSQHG